MAVALWFISSSQRTILFTTAARTPQLRMLCIPSTNSHFQFCIEPWSTFISLIKSRNSHINAPESTICIRAIKPREYCCYQRATIVLFDWAYVIVLPLAWKLTAIRSFRMKSAMWMKQGKSFGKNRVFGSVVTLHELRDWNTHFMGGLVMCAYLTILLFPCSKHFPYWIL